MSEACISGDSGSVIKASHPCVVNRTVVGRIDKFHREGISDLTASGLNLREQICMPLPDGKVQRI